MMLSIIIPVYNVEKYISQCIESVLAQSDGNWELILVDDGSTDLSGSICDEYAKKDSRIRVYHKENSGVSSTRNTGLNYARGSYVSFVDSDDIVCNTYVETLLSHMQKCDLLFFSHETICNDEIESRSLDETKAIGTNEIDRCISDLKSKYDYEPFGYTWNKCFKKDVIINNSILFNPSLSFKEDELFTFQYCLYVKSVSVISSVLYRYRIVETGLTSRRKTSKELLDFSHCLNSLCCRIQDVFPLWYRIDKIRILKYIGYAIERTPFPRRANCIKEYVNYCSLNKECVMGKVESLIFKYVPFFLLIVIFYLFFSVKALVKRILGK